jgi:hypothetical protein
MQAKTEKPRNSGGSDGAGMYSISPSDFMTLQDTGPESRTNSLPSITILAKGINKEYSPDEEKEKSQITDITFPEGGWRAWSVVFGVRHFAQDA